MSQYKVEIAKLPYEGGRIEYFQLRGNQFQMEHSIEVKGLFEAIVLRIEEINKQSDLGD